MSTYHGRRRAHAAQWIQLKKTKNKPRKNKIKNHCRRRAHAAKWIIFKKNEEKNYIKTPLIYYRRGHAHAAVGDEQSWAVLNPKP
jgi:hypothetical protein